jgi:hypothetical protein
MPIVHYASAEQRRNYRDWSGSISDPKIKEIGVKAYAKVTENEDRRFLKENVRAAYARGETAVAKLAKRDGQPSSIERHDDRVIGASIDKERYITHNT